MNVIVNENKCFNLWKQDLSMADYREVHHKLYFLNSHLRLISQVNQMNLLAKFRNGKSEAIHTFTSYCCIL